MAAGVTATPTANTDPEKVKGFHARGVVWPLMATAAIRRKHGESPFIAEYIIPQLILQWITDEKAHNLDGIAYSSVRCKAHVAYPATIANLVFPARTITASGHCPILKQKFAMTIPVPWHILARSNLPQVMPLSGRQTIEVVPGLPLSYYEMEFYQVEAKLIPFEAKVIK